ncbi:hypothetical protein M0R45_002579 [Rubus argutus]|uniref:Uncharacterized protein n=1 Tax=Rubus argutus TaxID=59490 RepID=A0AAW1VNE4_RUBAR
MSLERSVSVFLIHGRVRGVKFGILGAPPFFKFSLPSSPRAQRQAILNEAGYDQQVGRTEGEKNSVSYNENAFLMTCKSMLYTLHKPPKHFEGLVMEHFTQRSENILMACKAYMEGTPIGCAVDFPKTEDQHSKGSSTGFKLMLAKLFQKLVEAIFCQGNRLQQFHHGSRE